MGEGRIGEVGKAGISLMETATLSSFSRMGDYGAER